MNGKDSSGIDRTCDVQYRAFIVSKVGVFLKESKKKLLMKEKEYN